jgi:hypothetical protein
VTWATNCLILLSIASFSVALLNAYSRRDSCDVLYLVTQVSLSASVRSAARVSRNILNSSIYIRLRSISPLNDTCHDRWSGCRAFSSLSSSTRLSHTRIQPFKQLAQSLILQSTMFLLLIHGARPTFSGVACLQLQLLHGQYYT